MAAISARMMSRGSRYSGTPSTNMPPAQILRLEDRRLETHQRQFVRAGQPRRAGADDRHLASVADALAARVAQLRIDAAEFESVRLDAEFFADETF